MNGKNLDEELVIGCTAFNYGRMLDILGEKTDQCLVPHGGGNG